MLEMYKTQKLKVLLYVIIVFTLIIIKNNVNAVTVSITGPNRINVGDTATVTIDFGAYIGAHDLFELTYNSRILNYTGTEELKYIFWLDSSADQKGIRYRTYTFKGLKNGTTTLGLTVEGLVSANSNIKELGNAKAEKKIIVGTGIEAGDVNNDGYINSTDAAFVLDFFKYGNATQTEFIRADVNEDNIINSIDAALILDIYKSN